MANKLDYLNLFNMKTNIPLHKIKRQTIFAIDPSGNKIDGHGLIGLVGGHYWYENDEFKLYISYHKTLGVEQVSRILNILKSTRPNVVIVEDYINYNKQATQFKRPETSGVVDLIENTCIKNKLEVFRPIASWHKGRITDSVLKAKKVDINQLNSRHEIDALRMVLKYCIYKIEKKREIENVY